MIFSRWKMLKNGQLLSFSIYWNLQKLKNLTYDMTVQDQIILLIGVLYMHHAHASSNLKMKYTKNSKMSKFKKMNFWHILVQCYWKSQPNWYTPLMFSENPTLGGLIYEIKWVGKLRQFSENQIKMDK